MSFTGSPFRLGLSGSCSYLNAQNQRVFFTPDIQGVSTAQHMSHSVIRLACYLAVVCGVSLRHIALLFSVLFLIPMSKSSIKRWIDDIGVPGAMSAKFTVSSKCLFIKRLYG